MTNFISSGQTLISGSNTSSTELEFQNSIDLNGNTRPIQVNASFADGHTVRTPLQVIRTTIDSKPDGLAWFRMH